MVDPLSKVEQFYNTSGQWVYIAPVSGVVLTEAVRKEFKIRRVLLVDAGKLPYIRKRIGLPVRLSQVKRQLGRDEFFASSQTFAVVRHTNSTPKEALSVCRKLVQDELAILAVSQLGFMKRRFGAFPRLKGSAPPGRIRDLLHSRVGPQSLLSGESVGKIMPLRLDQLWKDYHRKAFFFRLLKVINGEIMVAQSWRKAIERAAILVGQSFCSTEIAKSFLWNVIALETLLTEGGDKITTALPKRAEAFLGWVGFWEIENYPKRIEEIYRKRSAFVHEGKREDITVEDLLFTDDLLFNLLLNILRHIKLFSSRQAVTEFSKKVEAEKILGISPRVRPKTLIFVSRGYSQEDLTKI